jgi:hypothetical protein
LFQSIHLSRKELGGLLTEDIDEKPSQDYCKLLQEPERLSLFELGGDFS